MRGRSPGWIRFAAAGTASLALAMLGATAARADDPASLRGQAQGLQAANRGLAAETQQALLELYSLETTLRSAERRLATLERQAAAVEYLEASARERVRVARTNAVEAERRLASRLQTLYVEGDVDPLAVLLGAESLDEALTAFDGLGRVASDDRAIVGEVKDSRRRFQAALRQLSARRAELEGLIADERATRDNLVAARNERASYLVRLRGEEAFNRGLIGRLLAQASAAEKRTQEITPAPAPAPIAAAETTSTPAPVGGTQMIVSSTGYCLRGTTATGIQAGWGTIAVDPAVIPLGTKMFVPGYGDGVAADTGSAVSGRVIDVWFPTCAQALQWGRRVVTITLK